MLTGGAGKDILKGNSGNAIFDFNAMSKMGTTSTTWDIIPDFTIGDKIDISTLDANTATMANADNDDSNYEFAIQLIGADSLSSRNFIL